MAKSGQDLQHNYEGIKYDFIFPVDSLEKCRDIEYDESDVLIVGYPKTGKKEENKLLCKNCNIWSTHFRCYTIFSVKWYLNFF